MSDSFYPNEQYVYSFNRYGDWRIYRTYKAAKRELDKTIKQRKVWQEKSGYGWWTDMDETIYKVSLTWEIADVED